ncbi:hypothetical protein [Treponema phagedenis]|uniref:Uncharacterized protein n=1 Tax=Treponema phagedenis TaxID=162 RepID=A0AAE6IWG7_TREPH|nr:hypothetical protein [Treponema phagedenis]QEJ99473.1 hypothetical protein FUT82_16720 [Treponema phagedenis]QEK05044.1 hypothetical protein FUT83_15370 [Treponema phagedenis]QEK10665.1 hypothetical protein FUT81_15285 [Treponema phagedenis]
MSGTVIISLIGTLVGMLITVGGVFIAVGGLKQKINDSAETNKAQEDHIKTLASKDELAKAIKRSDELLELMKRRADEDRRSGERKYEELYCLLNAHSERISRLEVSQEQIFKILDKLDSTIENGFKEMKDDIRELRKEIKKD